MDAVPPPCTIHTNAADCRLAFESTNRPWVPEDGQCTLLGIKTAIVTCRRASSGSGRATRKKGRKAFQVLDAAVREHAEWLVQVLNLRWVVSICDSYVDWGPPIEARNAMLVSLLVNWERLVGTLLAGMTGGFAQRTGNVVGLWPGTTSISYKGRADTHRNLFRRLERMTDSTPHIHVFFLFAARVILEAERATPQRLGKVLTKQNIAEESLRVLGLTPSAKANLCY